MITSTAKGIFGIQDSIVMPTYKEQAYCLIKEAIIYQRFKLDEVYSQEGICTELGISRTPVREALLELQRDGYIRFSRGKGISIVSITNDEAKNILEMRLNNEQFGARLAAKRATPEHLESIKSVLEIMKANIHCRDTMQLYKLDRSFHRAVIEASQNMWLLKTIEDLRDHFLRFENKTAFDAMETSEAVLEEHTTIYNAISAHNEDDAETAMKVHLAYAYERTMIKYRFE